jgi:hypothetical protein
VRQNSSSLSRSAPLFSRCQLTGCGDTTTAKPRRCKQAIASTSSATRCSAAGLAPWGVHRRGRTGWCSTVTRAWRALPGTCGRRTGIHRCISGRARLTLSARETVPDTRRAYVGDGGTDPGRAWDSLERDGRGKRGGRFSASPAQPGTGRCRPCPGLAPSVARAPGRDGASGG